MKKWILGIGLCACVVLIGAKDYTQAFKLYTKACKSGIESSCADVGKMYDLGLAGGGDRSHKSKELLYESL